MKDLLLNEILVSCDGSEADRERNGSEEASSEIPRRNRGLPGSTECPIKERQMIHKREKGAWRLR